MGPRRKRFWLPLTRLGAFFAGVVVLGNVVFHAFRPSAAEFTSSPDISVDYFIKKKKRIERSLYRTMEKFLGSPAVLPIKEKLSEVPADDPVAEALPAEAQPGTEPLPPTATASLDPVPPPRAHHLGFIEPEPAPFTWPEPLPAYVPSGGFELPTSLALLEERTFRADLVTDLYRRNARDPVADVGDAVLRIPELLLDGIFSCAGGMGSRSATRGWDDDSQRSITAQILDVQIGARKERIWAEFMRQFTDREARYLGNFGESRANTWGFQNGTEGADLDALMLDQRKVFWDALRRTYVSRYKVQADEKIREEAWYLDRWTEADFLVLPPLLAGYVFYRGFDKKFSVVGTKVMISIEPVSEWYRPRHRDLPAAVALEWSMKGCPLGVIVSAGMHDGRYGLDFVGIGTTLGAVRQALVMQEDHRPR
jgi:hypothetical protein